MDNDETNIKPEGNNEIIAIISLLWVYEALLYLFSGLTLFLDSDFLSLFLSGPVCRMKLFREVMLVRMILMVFSIGMVFLSRNLNNGVNRWINIIAGMLLTVVQIHNLYVGKNIIFDTFFNALGFSLILLIIWSGWIWKNPDSRTGNKDYQ